MKRSKLKISEYEFKNYLIKHYIDDELNKVSDRDLWSREDFFETTGMYSINEYTGERKRVSAGTISYWKDKLEIREEDVYNYHYEKLKHKYPTYEEWSRCYNRGHKRKKTFTNNTIRNKLIKYMGFPSDYKHRTLSYVQNIAFIALGGDDKAKKQLNDFYEKVYSEVI